MSGEPSHPGDGEHAVVARLLPFLASGTLAGDEARRVERHLAGCARCQGERGRVEALRGAVRAADPGGGWSPSAAHLASVFEAIDHADGQVDGQGAAVPAQSTPGVERAASAALGAGREAAPSADRDRRPAQPGLLARLREWWAATPGAIRWTLAVQAAAVAALVVVVAGRSVGTGGDYRTLSRDEGKAGAPRALARVVFADEITGAELRALLLAVHARIVDGPSPRGVYTLELAQGIDASGAPIEPASQRIATLAAHPRVRFAQPLTP